MVICTVQKTNKHCVENKLVINNSICDEFVTKTISVTDLPLKPL